MTIQQAILTRMPARVPSTISLVTFVALLLADPMSADPVERAEVKPEAIPPEER